MKKSFTLELYASSIPALEEVKHREGQPMLYWKDQNRHATHPVKVTYEWEVPDPTITITEAELREKLREDAGDRHHVTFSINAVCKVLFGDTKT